MADNYTSDQIGDPTIFSKLSRPLRSFGHFLGTFGIGAGFVFLGTLIDTAGDVISGQFSRATKKFIAGSADTFVTSVTPLFNIVVKPMTGSSVGELTRQGVGAALDKVWSVRKSTMPVAGEGFNDMHAQLGGRDVAMMQNYYGQPALMGNSSVPAQVAYAPYAQPQMMLPEAGGGVAPAGYWFDNEATRRGVNPNEARQQFLRGEGRQHVAELMTARETAPGEVQR